MRVILLAAGYGTRLRPLTNKTPKCLVKIANKPLIDYWFDIVIKNKNTKVLVNTHYLSEKVERHIKLSSYKNNIKITYEPILLGTAGTVLANMDFIGNETLLLAHADNFTIFNLEEFLSAHASRPEGCDMTMMLFKSTDPSSCGVVKINEKKIVTDFYEKVKKPPSNLANGAVYLIEPKMIRKISKVGSINDFSTQVIPKFMGCIFSFLNDKYHRDIGTLESLEKANFDFSRISE